MIYFFLFILAVVVAYGGVAAAFLWLISRDGEPDDWSNLNDFQ